jgi:hypothetical protein
MKAYRVMYADDDWCDFTHAANGQEARVKFFRQWGEGEYIDVRAYREKLLDDLPLTGINIVNAGYDPDWMEYKTDTCRCGLCQIVRG